MGLKKRTKVNAEFNMSSLTDIIFLLLIFFMLTSSMVVPNALNLKLPSSSRKTTNQPKYPPTEIKISANGQYTIDGRDVSLLGLEKVVRQLKKERTKYSMIVYGDDRVGHERVAAVLDIAARYQVDAVIGDLK